MKIYTIKGDYRANCYILEKNGEFLIVDAAYSFDDIWYVTKKKPLAMLLTHGHYDHIVEIISYIKEKVDIYANQNINDKLMSSRSNVADLFGTELQVNPSKVVFFKTNKITIGPFDIEILITPGHTNCSVCYIIEDAIFTGDTLFKGNIGRYDLPTANYDDLMNSLKQLKNIKSDLKVYPGHGEVTTLDKEKKENIYLKYE